MSRKILTTAEAAELAGVTVASLRSTTAKLRRRGVNLLAPRTMWPNAREARYDRSAVIAWRNTTPTRNGEPK